MQRQFQEKYLVMNNNDRDEKVDIVLQRAGISLENKGTSSSLSVWYKDRDNTIVSRNIIPYSYVTEKKYYKGKDSLYKFAEDWGLNSYEFDIIKRIVRCRHKGSFHHDLVKTKDLIDIYLREQEHHYLDITK